MFTPVTESTRLRSRAPWLLPALALLTALLLPAAAVHAEELHSYALVQDDGSLLIKGRIVHLDGIYLPPTGRQCLS